MSASRASQRLLSLTIPRVSSQPCPRIALPSQRALSFSSTPTRPAGHGPTYDAPTGWLFGIKPGEKYQNEGWENIWFYGFFGALAACTIGYIYKPDTSIQTWALEEARRRLEKEGYLPDPSGAREG